MAFGPSDRETTMLVLVWPATRHFSEELRDLKYAADYCRVQ